MEYQLDIERSSHKNGTSDGYSFSEANYKAGKCGSGYTLTGDLPQGNATYDAARANMGSPYKMPTKDQYQELIDNTHNKWTTINGVYGMKIINMYDPNKYIFLPAGGRQINTTYDNVGDEGNYWSTTWHDWNNSFDAWCLTFAFRYYFVTQDRRYAGLPIRAIRPLKF